MDPIRAHKWIESLLCSNFRGKALPLEPLARFTTWRIGGPAELLVQPADREDLTRALRWAIRENVPWRVLGNGSNLLVREAGVPGLVIRLRRLLDGVEFDGAVVEAGAGASLPAVANQVAQRGLAGLEFGAGIPGTVGGALVMNAGWHEYEIGNRVEHVDALDDQGQPRRLSREQCRFAYRHSLFRDRHWLILGSRLRLEPDDPQRVRERLSSFAASRKNNQPTELPSCGSVFLKPTGDFAGRLIEEAGLKGHRIGGIEVSTLHANFFVNRGDGTATDALHLVEHVEQEVARRFGVALIREFELW